MSEEDGHAKPHSVFFERALRMIGRPRAGDVLMVGDNWEADILGAHRMGMATCWYNPGRASRPDEVAPTLEIHALEELLRHLD
jgi:FMN phosphatase YigB (HAD superfamily)